MRILFIVHQSPPEFHAGTEGVTLRLAQSAQRFGHRVQIATTSVMSDAIWPETDSDGLRHAVVDGVPVCAACLSLEPFGALGLRPILDDPAASKLAAFVKSSGPYDIVHLIHSFRMLAFWRKLLETTELPYIVTATDFFLLCHRVNLVQKNGQLCDGPEQGRRCIVACPEGDLTFSDYSDRIERHRELIERSSAFSVPSAYVKSAFLREGFPVPLVIAHGVANARMRSRSARLVSQHSGVRFGYVGTISRVKGVITLASAFVKLAHSTAALQVAGPEFEPETSSLLKALSTISPKIELQGQLPHGQVFEFIMSIDVLCIPSEVPESFSLVLHEAFALGVPCVVADIGNLGQIVRETGCGLAVEAGSVEAWCAALGRVADSPDLIRSWIERLPVVNTVEEEAFLYNELYLDVLSQREQTRARLGF